MYTFKTHNNIAKEGTDILIENNFAINEVEPDALLIRSFILEDKNFNKSLKCISRAGAGVNHIPIEIATEKGIVVFNTPGGNANAVKELVICGLLLSSRGIIQGHLFAEGIDEIDPIKVTNLVEGNKKNFKGNELKGKTVGIVGLGSIGSLLAQSLEVMGMKVIGYDPSISVDAAWQLPKEVEKAESLKYLLSNSDYISLHVPLVEDTRNLISKETIKFIKKGAKLINLSRGEIVNNQDLLNALKENHISSFVTDFPTPEMIQRSKEFNDVILLPHLGASTKEAEINCAIMAAEQVKNFLQEGVIKNSVNFPTIKLSKSSNNRLILIHPDEPGMLGKITNKIAKEKLNISDMINKSRNNIAVTLIDTSEKPSDDLINAIRQIPSLVSARLCK